MGEIICSECGYMNSHLQFHSNMPFCIKCYKALGIWCNICKQLVCNNCHLGEHIND